MAGNEYTKYQADLIRHYYQNLDSIMLAKLSDLVTELYLADTSAGRLTADAKRARLWQRAQTAMTKLKVPPAIIDHIMKKRDVQVLAKNLQDWLAAERKNKK
jgi:hypothetical protein